MRMVYRKPNFMSKILRTDNVSDDIAAHAGMTGNFRRFAIEATVPSIGASFKNEKTSHSGSSRIE